MSLSTECAAALLSFRYPSLLSDFDYDHNLFEYEQNSASPLLKGRLKTKLDYWHAIGANNFVIGTIKFGYRILGLLLVLRVGLCFITISQLWRMRLLSSRLYLN